MRLGLSTMTLEIFRMGTSNLVTVITVDRLPLLSVALIGPILFAAE